MKDDAFKYSMHYRGDEMKDQNHFSRVKQEVWKEFIKCYNYDKNKNYTLMNVPMFEQLGYSVEESSWWRDKHAS